MGGKWRRGSVYDERDEAVKQCNELRTRLATAEAALERADEFRRFVVERGHHYEYVEWAARRAGETDLADILAANRSSSPSNDDRTERSPTQVVTS